MRPGQDFELVNPQSDGRYRDYWESYHRLAARKGVTMQYAKIELRRRHTLIGAMMIHKGDADGMICGTFGTHSLHLHYVDQAIGRRPGCAVYAAMNVLMLPGRQLALVDTHVNVDPSAEELAEITVLAAEQMRRLGFEPAAALVARAGPRSRRRDARRLRGRPGDAAVDHAVFDVAPRGQPDRLPEHRIGQHLLQPAQGDGRQ